MIALYFTALYPTLFITFFYPLMLGHEVYKVVCFPLLPQVVFEGWHAVAWRD